MNNLVFKFNNHIFTFDKVHKHIHVEEVSNGEYIDCIEVGYDIDLHQLEVLSKEWSFNN